jgi:hypothetical protein
VLLLLVVVITLGVLKVIHCWGGANYTQCRAIDDWTPFVLFWGICIGIRLYTGFWAWSQYNQRLIEQAERNRLNLTLDRFGDPIPANLYQLLDAEQMIALVMQRYTMATQLKAVTAKYEQNPGLNNYAPTFSFNGKQDPAPTIESTPIVLPLLEQGKPVLEQLIDRSHICRSGQQVMVGYGADGTPGYLNFDGSPLVAVAGASGFGKSSFVRFALAQMAMQPGSEPAGLVLCDPHGAVMEKSLAVSCRPLEEAESYLMPVAMAHYRQ